MRALRSYNQATIFFRNEDDNYKNGEYYDVRVFTGQVFYYDTHGNEHMSVMYYIKEIIEYIEDRIPKESSMPDPKNAGQSPTVDLSNPMQKGGKKL